MSFDKIFYLMDHRLIALGMVVLIVAANVQSINEKYESFRDLFKLGVPDER